MGDEVSRRTKRAFTEGLKKITDRLDQSLESEKAKNDFLERVPAVVEGLRSGKIQCRVYRRDKFHPKAYLSMAAPLARLGGEPVALHLLESPKLDKPITEFIGGRNLEVEKISWSRNTMWVDKAQTTVFKAVHEDVWNFHIGGYHVCEKWLKDRQGRTLSKDDITHYHKIVVALSETIRRMKEIDEVINRHGGWPGAFVSGIK